MLWQHLIDRILIIREQTERFWEAAGRLRAKAGSVSRRRLVWLVVALDRDFVRGVLLVCRFWLGQLWRLVVGWGQESLPEERIQRLQQPEWYRETERTDWY